MYKAYFHLTRSPFDLTPDPTCFVPTVRHNETLAALYYGVRRHKGLVVVTGEVGTGKTLLLRCLLKLLEDSHDIAYAYMFNNRLTSYEFLQYIAMDFGLPAAGKNKSELLFSLSEFLISRAAKQLSTVLIVDEAHQMSDELLEEVRLLSNLETYDDKLLQIVMVGQPELDSKLDSVGLRQLKQRISLRTYLTPLSYEETARYIEQRLQLAGGGEEAATLFPQKAVESVFRYSRGFPRLINTICENSLITAYAHQLQTVPQDVIEEVAREFRLDSAPFSEGGRLDLIGQDYHRANGTHLTVESREGRAGADASRVVDRAKR